MQSKFSHAGNRTDKASTCIIVVVVVLLFYTHGKHLRSCQEGQLS